MAASLTACAGRSDDGRQGEHVPDSSHPDAVGIFPDDHALQRLAGSVLIGAHDEWHVSDRRYLSKEPMAELLTPELTVLHGNDTPDSPPDGSTTLLWSASAQPNTSQSRG